MKHTSVKDFFEVLFDSTDETCFAPDKYGTKVFAVKEYLKFYDAEFFGLNPMIYSRGDDHCTKFQNILCEIDVGTLEQQDSAIKNCGFPYSTQVFSGGKSYHFILSLAKARSTKFEYEILVRRVFKALRNNGIQVDTSCKNPSRLTRFPNNSRLDTGKTQTLIDVRDRVSDEALESWLVQNGAGPEQSSQNQPFPVIMPKGYLSARTRNLLMFGVVVNGRNNEIFAAACDYKRNGYSMEQAFKDLAVTDLPEREFKNAVESAYSKSR